MAEGKRNCQVALDMAVAAIGRADQDLWSETALHQLGGFQNAVAMVVSGEHDDDSGPKRFLGAHEVGAEEPQPDRISQYREHGEKYRERPAEGTGFQESQDLFFVAGVVRVKVPHGFEPLIEPFDLGLILGTQEAIAGRFDSSLAFAEAGWPFIANCAFGTPTIGGFVSIAALNGATGCSLNRYPPGKSCNTRELSNSVMRTMSGEQPACAVQTPNIHPAHPAAADEQMRFVNFNRGPARKIEKRRPRSRRTRSPQGTRAATSIRATRRTPASNAAATPARR